MPPTPGTALERSNAQVRTVGMRHAFTGAVASAVTISGLACACVLHAVRLKQLLMPRPPTTAQLLCCVHAVAVDVPGLWILEG
jgi:hypothetical protein